MCLVWQQQVDASVPWMLPLPLLWSLLPPITPSYLISHQLLLLSSLPPPPPPPPLPPLPSQQSDQPCSSTPSVCRLTLTSPVLRPGWLAASRHQGQISPSSSPLSFFFSSLTPLPSIHCALPVLCRCAWVSVANWPNLIYYYYYYYNIFSLFPLCVSRTAIVLKKHSGSRMRSDWL